jgi:hypothetical protein
MAVLTTKKAEIPTSSVKVATKNSLRTTPMDTDAPDTESRAAKEAVPERVEGKPRKTLIELAGCKTFRTQTDF